MASTLIRRCRSGLACSFLTARYGPLCPFALSRFLPSVWLRRSMAVSSLSYRSSSLSRVALSFFVSISALFIVQFASLSPLVILSGAPIPHRLFPLSSSFLNRSIAQSSFIVHRLSSSGALFPSLYISPRQLSFFRHGRCLSPAHSLLCLAWFGKYSPLCSLFPLASHVFVTRSLTRSVIAHACFTIRSGFIILPTTASIEIFTR